MINIELGSLTTEQLKDIMAIRNMGIMPDEELQKIIDREVENNRKVENSNGVHI